MIPVEVYDQIYFLWHISKEESGNWKTYVISDLEPFWKVVAMEDNWFSSDILHTEEGRGEDMQKYTYVFEEHKVIRLNEYEEPVQTFHGIRKDLSDVEIIFKDGDMVVKKYD